MPGIGHIAVGATAGRLFARRNPRGRARAMAAMSALSLLPDVDGLAFTFGIPYGAPFGHRGASHSLFVAAAAGLAVGALARKLGAPAWKTGLYSGAVMASHGLLDAMTNGGLGIALLWPFTNRRFFFPWRPIPVAPIGLGMLSRRGFEVTVAELALFIPFFVFAFFPRKRK